MKAILQHCIIVGLAPLPMGVQIPSFSCSFRQKVCKIIPLWELVPPRKSWIRHLYTFLNSFNLINFYLKTSSRFFVLTSLLVIIKSIQLGSHRKKFEMICAILIEQYINLWIGWGRPIAMFFDFLRLSLGTFFKNIGLATHRTENPGSALAWVMKALRG